MLYFLDILTYAVYLSLSLRTILFSSFGGAAGTVHALTFRLVVP